MTAYWNIWLLAIVVTFAIGETYALKCNKTTLSRHVWNASKAFPLLPCLVGIVIGVVIGHFWWGGIVCFEP